LPLRQLIFGAVYIDTGLNLGRLGTPGGVKVSPSFIATMMRILTVVFCRDLKETL
jgi:hypothetical protein